jgi:8-oxo-dGTP pyrophosphatase MutT (NUDIX family)
MSYISYIRDLVGHQKIFLAFASVILRDEAGRILLQRRADFNTWGLPGGSLELGEDIVSCARRELLEESGLTAGPLRLIGIYSEPAYDTVYPNGDQVQQYTVCFEGCRAGGELVVDGIETRDVRFFAPESRHCPAASFLPGDDRGCFALRSAGLFLPLYPARFA